MGDFTDLELRVYPRDGDVYPVELAVDYESCVRGVLAAEVLSSAPAETPAEEGQRLFAALFSTEELRNAWADVRTRNVQRRVRLWLDPDDADLHALPWELLHDGQLFLSSGGVTPFSRYIPSTDPWPRGEQSRSIRVLVAISSPTDLETYRLPQVDMEAERKKFNSFLGGGHVTVDFLNPPVAAATIEQSLQAGSYAALHFVGHAVPGRREGVPLLCAQDDEGRIAPLSGANLMEMFARLERPPRMVFLAAAQNTLPIIFRVYSRLAVSMVKAGFPAVIAKRDAIVASTAQVLLYTFYTRLAEHGQVDTALNEARSYLLTARHADPAVPALWTRLRSGQLWREPLDGAASGLG